ncbi:MAG: Anti-sigma B factor antagonist RsbV [Firmicutes bacterium]|nr:Anti-sigma B factor antagonist RsbV [Bacillota bacterium]MDI6706772.1 STAS domain-containing protein [Bacillota bacterium]
MDSINCYYDKDNARWMAELKGEIDIYSAAEFKKALNSAFEEKIDDLYLDCKELSYMDSTGLGVLIGALKRIKEQDKNIYLKNLKPNVMKLFLITGLDKIFILEG